MSGGVPTSLGTPSASTLAFSIHARGNLGTQRWPLVFISKHSNPPTDLAPGFHPDLVLEFGVGRAASAEWVAAAAAVAGTDQVEHSLHTHRDRSARHPKGSGDTALKSRHRAALGEAAEGRSSGACRRAKAGRWDTRVALEAFVVDVATAFGRARRWEGSCTAAGGTGEWWAT